MHENKFEKQVREKMDQLGFDPSEAVWTQVDQAINSEKKRRRPIFWIFFLSGLIIAGGAGYMAFNHFSQIKNPTIKPTQSLNINQDTPQSKSVRTEKTVQDESGQQEQLDGTSALRAGRNSGSFLSGKPGLVRSERKSLTKTANTVTMAVDKKVTEQQRDKLTQVPAEYRRADSNSITKLNPQVNPDHGEKLNKTQSADSVSLAPISKTKKTETKKNPWSIAFTGSLGVSNINQSLFHSLNRSNLSYAANYTGTSVSLPSAAISVPSPTSAGFSFAVGVSIKHNLSKRISGSAGLGYHYYSTTIHTGIPVDSALILYSRFAQTTAVNSFYRNGEGKEFTNQYHFVELPVNLSFQLNKSRRNPVNWEAGFSLTWLVSANALQFDPYTNVYFKNNQLFNQIQWDAATAILIGFPVHNRSLQLGPQFQYNLTSLSKDNSTYPGHLIYFGLKCSFSR